MALEALLKEAQKHYDSYLEEQAKLSKDGNADPEFIELMTASKDFEDERMRKLVEKWRLTPVELVDFSRPWGIEDGRYVCESATVAVPARRLPVTSPLEKDARLIERGADWLEKADNSQWVRGWQAQVTLPDGRTADGRCALGSILASFGDFEGSDEGGRILGRVNRALSRVGLSNDAVISWNDGPALDRKQVGRFLRGVAWAIREGVSLT